MIRALADFTQRILAGRRRESSRVSTLEELWIQWEGERLLSTGIAAGAKTDSIQAVRPLHIHRTTIRFLCEVLVRRMEGAMSVVLYRDYILQ